MLSKFILPAAAVVGSVAGQSASCTQSTAVINAPADATNLANCQTFKGSINVNTGAIGNIDLTGISQITGDLIVKDNGGLTGLASSTLNSIGGAFTLANLTGLSSLSMTSLTSVGTLSWTSLTALNSLTFGNPGLTSAKSIVIGDTFLNSLTGVDVKSTQSIDINNNHQLTSWTSSLANLSNVLNLQANGLNFAVSLPNLVWIANMTIGNVTTFDAPSLQTINGSARFDSNYFTSFNAPNLTSTQHGDISFVSNVDITNITMPQLNSVAGALLIANNTALQKINGFPKLKSIGGSIKLRGSFNDIEFPSLNGVVGTFDASSTADITDSCNAIKPLAPSKQGGNGKIQGNFSCTSNNQNANQDTNSTTGTSGGGSSSSSGGGNSAAGVVVNTAMLSLAVIGGFVAML